MRRLFHNKRSQSLSEHRVSLAQVMENAPQTSFCLYLCPTGQVKAQDDLKEKKTRGKRNYHREQNKNYVTISLDGLLEPQTEKQTFDFDRTKC